MAILRSASRRSKRLSAKKGGKSLKSESSRKSHKVQASDNASTRQKVRTRSLKKKEELDQHDIGNNCIEFNSSSLDAKPPNPYRIGYHFKAQSHIPEKELPANWECCQSDEWFNYMTLPNLLPPAPRLRCETYPPLAGVIGEDSVELEIQGWVRVGEEDGAQLFTVCPNNGFTQEDTSIMKDLPQSGLIAKVYDPLYTHCRYWCKKGIHCVDEWYLREANAYQALLDLQGIGIPKYYGSYSVTLPLPLPRSDKGLANREVRMILMGLVKGITLSDFHIPTHLPQQVRKNILRALIELESEIYQRGIDIGPLKPRNVILKEPIDDSSKPEVVIVDFERAFNRCDQKAPPGDESISIPNPKRFAGKYISPLLRWRYAPYRFERWIDWDWTPWVHSEFRHTARKITREMREVWGDPA